MILLDTSAVVEWLNGTKAGKKVEKICAEHNVRISAITLNEALIIDGRENALGLFRVVDFDAKTAHYSAELERVLKKKGKPLSKLDTLIAGTAMTYNVTLLTLDNDFKHVPGLDVVMV
ncbi:MAG: type II toxin-antitoxin system VapC family toxin [Candidatus Woesearchaeota archaeon]|nr:type II toxin-antitoxin system VapC family toxin [Candidatus Woesearchaeota archaeon]